MYRTHVASRDPRVSAQRGTILVLTLVLSLIIALTITSAVIISVTLGKNSQHSFNQAEALALAEGVTELAQKEMLTTVANFENFSLDGKLAVCAGDSAAKYPYTITAIGASQTRTDPDGISMAIQTYRISSTAQIGQSQSSISRIVDLTMTPIFQYMIFFNDDLEILPGPDMTLGGRVHSNEDIYVGSGATLTVDSDYFRSTGQIYRKRKNDGTDTTGTIKIKKFQESTYEAMNVAEDSSSSKWLALSNEKWKGTVQSGAHGVKEIAAPKIGNIKAYDADDSSQKGYYHASAGLVVINGQAYNQGGAPISLPAGTVTEKTMYDAREGKTITVTNIDIGLLNSTSYYPSNGLIYAYRTDATSSQPNGVRLSNAQELHAALTVVTEDPLFIQGDFNTVNKKGASVIADAVNLLSNKWDDSKTAGNLPEAKDTQYNVAIITGNVPTPDGGGDYSGGFENLVRFHEKWSGKTAKIRGAFIKIFASELAKSHWIYGGDIYEAPTRDFQFDADLLNIKNMPPYTPNAVYFTRVMWDDGLPLPMLDAGVKSGYKGNLYKESTDAESQTDTERVQGNKYGDSGKNGDTSDDSSDDRGSTDTSGTSRVKTTDDK